MTSAVTTIVPSSVKTGPMNLRDECAHIAHTGQLHFEKGKQAEDYLQYGPSDSYEQTTRIIRTPCFTAVIYTRKGARHATYA
jgi:hypothetical protein